MTFCLKGKELLQGLQRADWLPPFDDGGMRTILGEVDELHNRLNDIATKYGEDNARVPDGVKVSSVYYHQCIKRNHRYIDSYLHNRLVKLRQLRWLTGPVLPEHIHHDTLSAREKEYFMSYNDLLTDYNDALDLDLTTDLEPPKDLRVEVRVLQDCGKIMTESGPVSLDKGSIHFLRRAEVEQFIREGKVEHQLTDDQR